MLILLGSAILLSSVRLLTVVPSSYIIVLWYNIELQDQIDYTGLTDR